MVYTLMDHRIDAIKCSELGSETTHFRLVVPPVIWTFYDFISIVHKSVDHEKIESFAKKKRSEEGNFRLSVVVLRDVRDVLDSFKRPLSFSRAAFLQFQQLQPLAQATCKRFCNFFALDEEGKEEWVTRKWINGLVNKNSTLWFEPGFKTVKQTNKKRKESFGNEGASRSSRLDILTLSAEFQVLSAGFCPRRNWWWSMWASNLVLPATWGSPPPWRKGKGAGGGKRRVVGC